MDGRLVSSDQYPLISRVDPMAEKNTHRSVRGVEFGLEWRKWGRWQTHGVGVYIGPLPSLHLWGGERTAGIWRMPKGNLPSLHGHSQRKVVPCVGLLPFIMER